MRKFLLSLTLLFTSIGLISARTIKGTVSDQDGELPGANVVIKGTTSGTTTDMDGKYEIEVENGQVLQFSFVGNQTQSVTVTAKTPSTLNITLKADDKVLDELVVVGYGVMKKSDLTGSVSGVKESKLKETTSASIDQALQGRVSGVSVTSSSGQPGAATAVRVRGTSSLTGNNDPLYVVDGMPIGGGKQSTGANPLASINPADIVKMEVLKDASATAIYGAKAANGVIMITTRKGQSGDAKISYNGQLMLSELPKKLDMMNQKEYAEFYSQPDVMSALNIGAVDPMYQNLNFVGPGTDWQDEIFQTGLGHQHQLSVSGGSETTRYNFSLGYLDQDGILLNTNYNRFNGRVNLEADAKKWLTTGMSLAYMRSQQTKHKGFDLSNANNDLQALGTDGSLDEDNPIMQALKARPTDSPIDADGNYTDTRNAVKGVTTAVKQNPVQTAKLAPINVHNNNVLGNVFAQIKFINKGPQQLLWRNELGIDYTSGEERQYNSKSLGQNPQSRLEEWRKANFYYRGASTLTYMNTFKEKHNLSIMVGAELSKAAWEGTYNETQNQIDDAFFEEEAQNAALGDVTDLGAYKGDVRTISYLARLNYSYDNRYSLTATGRYDGSSTLSEDNRWGFFPSFALAWNIKNEGFMQDSKLFSQLKLRVGYGQTGNSGSNINYLTTYKRSYTGGKDKSYSYVQAKWLNSDLIWETNWQVNAGIDFGIIDNRISGSFDVFLKRNQDLIYTANPGWTLATNDDNYTSPSDINIGTMENKGFDLSISSKNIVTKISGLQFEWDTDLNFSVVKNEVVDLGGEESEASMYAKSNNRNICLTREGDAPGLFYGYKTDGLIQNSQELAAVTYPDGFQVGDLKIVDVNGDKTIDEKDRTVIGDPNPDFTCGLGNSFSLGNEKSGIWSLNVMLNATVGNDVFNLVKMSTEGLDEANVNYLTSALDFARVKTDENNNQYIVNSGTDVPRPTSRAEINSTRVTDRYVEDGSFLRISNIGLSYSFPTAWVKKMYLSRLALSANVQNVYTFTNYSGYDPEVPNGNPMLQGIDYGAYPNPRMFVFGVNVDF